MEIDSAMGMEIDSAMEMEIELSDGCRFGSAMNMAEESAMEIELPNWFLSFFIGKDPSCGLLPTMKDVAPEDSWVINEILSRLPTDLAPNDLGLINQILSRLPEDSWLIKGIQSRLPAELIPHGVPAEDSSSSEDSYVTNGSLFSLPEEDTSLPPEDSRVVNEILTLPDEVSGLVKEILPQRPDEDSKLVKEDSKLGKLSERVKEILSIPCDEDLQLFVHLKSEHLEAMDDILSVVPAGLASQVSSIFRNILSCGHISDVECFEQTIALLHGRLGDDVRWLLSKILNHLLHNMFTFKSSYILPPLPDNVAIMILSRLSTKSLAKYLCVSNHLLMAIYTMGILKPISGLFIHRTPFVLSQEIYLPLSSTI